VPQLPRCGPVPAIAIRNHNLGVFTVTEIVVKNLA
jgi:hypothetical protein